MVQISVNKPDDTSQTTGISAVGIKDFCKRHSNDHENKDVFVSKKFHKLLNFSVSNWLLLSD